MMTDSADHPPSYFKRLWLKWRAPGAKDEFKALMDDHDEAKDTLSDDEKDLISAVLDFDDVTAEQACIPRSEIIYIKASDTFSTIWETFATSRHTRLPVCGDDLDDVKGFITLKDVIPHAQTNGKNFALATTMRQAVFVPASMTLPDVLRIIRTSRSALVLVADEYGGTTGLLTLKDIIEELVGDLDDEHAPTGPVQLIPLGNNTYSVDPRADLEDLADQLKQDALRPHDESPVDTLGGLVLKEAGRVPVVGEEFTLPGEVTAKVLESDGRRIQRLSLHVPPASQEA